jgi:septum formation protein
MRNETRIILASASPRRRELLSQIGLDFEVMVSQVEEKASSMLPELVVEELSAQKAEAVLAALPDSRENVLVIGADTVVALEGQILGKPRSTQEAARMLRSLSGKAHGVYTGVTLLYRPGGRPSREGTGTGRGEPCPSGKPCLTVRKTFHERTDVVFCPLTEEEIAFYVSSGDCMDKAGAYGIQGIFARYVKGIRGDYNNVVGLPVGRLYQEAKEWLI